MKDTKTIINVRKISKNLWREVKLKAMEKGLSIPNAVGEALALWVKEKK